MKSPVNVNKENVFFTSDLHFSHKFMAEYRGYSSVEQMNEEIIEKWNDTVNQYSNVFHLGDFSFANAYKTIEILKRLKGRKVFIWGNHDDHLRKPRLIEHLTFAADYLYQKVDGQKIMMLHFPILHWRDARYGSWHLHGHLHGNPNVAQGKILDVGWDTKRGLYSYHEIEEIMKSKECTEHHTE